ncbi:MAG: response regulator [Proteobacteria bacterium]|nr:response regulator [Pseudomonadota bacterium]
MSARANIYGFNNPFGSALSDRRRRRAPRLSESAVIQQPSSAGDSTKASKHESCTVLVVDDEMMVRAVVGEMLRALGYAVCEADSAKAAIALLRKGRSITTIITDIQMPDITGIELANMIRHARPDIRVIYMTAYAKEATQKGNQLLNHDVLVKPFTFDQLESVMIERLQQH